MSRTTCQNGFVFVAAIGLGLMVSSARGGDLVPSAPPTSSNSAMWTLQNIYDVLNTRTTNVTMRDTFKDPTGGPTSGTMHTLDEIMTLVTNRAPVQKTGSPFGTGTPGSDGALKIGVAWPNPRFTIQTNTNCVRDNLTGLIWARNANLASGTAWSATGTCTWYQAFDVITNGSGPVNGATYGGANDWRLPNRHELYSLMTYKYFSPTLCDTLGTGPWTENDPFTDANHVYWSSNTYKGSTDYAWGVYLSSGYIYFFTKANADNLYVWPVRGPQ